MKKAMLFFGLFLAVLLSVQAQTPSHELAKLFHGERIDRVANSVYETVSEVDKKDVLIRLNTKKDLVISQIASIYNAQFSANEIQQLLAFYRSPLCRKWNLSRAGLQKESMEMVMLWEDALREKDQE